MPRFRPSTGPTARVAPCKSTKPASARRARVAAVAAAVAVDTAAAAVVAAAAIKPQPRSTGIQPVATAMTACYATRGNKTTGQTGGASLPLLFDLQRSLTTLFCNSD